MADQYVLDTGMCRRLGRGQIISIVDFVDLRSIVRQPIERRTYATRHDLIANYGALQGLGLIYDYALMDHVLILEAIHPAEHHYGSAAIIRIVAAGVVRWASAWPDDVILLHQEASKP